MRRVVWARSPAITPHSSPRSSSAKQSCIAIVLLHVTPLPTGPLSAASALSIVCARQTALMALVRLNVRRRRALADLCAPSSSANTTVSGRPHASKRDLRCASRPRTALSLQAQRGPAMRQAVGRRVPGRAAAAVVAGRSRAPAVRVVAYRCGHAAAPTLQPAAADAPLGLLGLGRAALCTRTLRRRRYMRECVQQQQARSQR